MYRNTSHKVTAILERQGYRVVGVGLPVPGDKLPSGLDVNFAVIRQAVEHEVELGNDVWLVIHSASGAIGPAAIKGLTRTRGSSRPGVFRILAISAILAPPGKNAVEDAGLVPLPFDEPGDEPQELGKPRCSPVKALYNDMTETDQYEAYDLMTPIYPNAMLKPWDYAGWNDVPLTYVFCKKDKAILLALQQEFLANIRIDAEIRELDASHSPFYSKPGELAELIVEAAKTVSGLSIRATQGTDCVKI